MSIKSKFKKAEYVETLAENAIAFIKSSPCSICSGEDSHTHKCWVGYTRRGSCPVYKNLKKRLEGLK